MSRPRFTSGARLRWQGVTYQIIRLLPDAQANLENLLTGATAVVEIATLVKALFAAELAFIADRQLAPLPGPAQEDSAGPRSLADYPAALVAIARYRLSVIEPLLAPPRTRAAVIARVQALKATQSADGERQLAHALSVATVYRWLDDYTRSGHDLRALIPAVRARGGAGASRLRTEVETLADATIQDKYDGQEKTTIDDVRHELAVRLAEENRVRAPQDQLALPSRATLARRIAATHLGQEQNQRRTQRTAKNATTQYGQTPYPDWPLERVEIDHTRTDLIVIDDRDDLPLGRLTLTYCLDTATRYPLGYYLGFEPPSYLTAMECLHHAICPKPDVRQLYGAEHAWLAYGIPATLVIDNGKEFIGHDLADACLLLGIVLQYTPVQTPQFKAAVERMFGSLDTMLFHTLPGTTFANAAERGNYQSAEQACVYLSAVDKLLNIFLVDVYAERFHRGLDGIPARCWAAKTQHGFAPALPPSATELTILLGRATTRVVQHYGIDFASLRYNCDALAALRMRLQGQPAKVKYHPADLSCLYVYDAAAEQYLRVPALDQEYTRDLSLWKHRVIRQAVLAEQDRVDMAALGQAKRKIQQIVEAGRQRKRQQTRTRIARWDTAGKPTRAAALGPAPKPEQVFLPAAAASTAAAGHESDSPTAAPVASPEAGWELTHVPLKQATTTADATEAGAL
jgi:putative transposase